MSLYNSHAIDKAHDTTIQDKHIDNLSKSYSSMVLIEC